MNRESLETFILLSRAKKYLNRMEHSFSDEDAHEWASRMSPPAHWTMDQTTAVMEQKGYTFRPCEFFVVMNTLFSDYGRTVTKYGMDRADFWAEMAYDWICDKDAVADKVGRYYREIVKHE